MGRYLPIITVVLAATSVAACVEDLSNDAFGVPADPNEPRDPDKELLVDDFSACNRPSFKTKINTEWTLYNDGPAPNNGSSTGDLEVTEPGYGTSLCGARFKGTITNQYEFGFAGIQTELGSAQPAAYRRLVLTVRGDKRRYRVNFPDKGQMERNEYDVYGQNFICGDGSSTWFDITIPYGDMAQEGWGPKVDLDMANVPKMQIQTKERPEPSFDFGCEFGLIRFTR